MVKKYHLKEEVKDFLITELCNAVAVVLLSAIYIMFV